MFIVVNTCKGRSLDLFLCELNHYNKEYMNSNVSKEIENGFLTAFVDASIPSSESFRPQFITNDYH